MSHGIPLLFVQRASDEPRRGTVLVLHGLSASKDLQLPELKSLAAAGYLAIGVDAPGHGDRFSGTLHQELQHTPEPARRRRINDLVRAWADELPALLTGLHTDGWIRSGGLGVVGISFGAYTVYRALLREARIGAAVAIIGSPDFRSGEADSPHLFPEKFFPTPLLSIGAGKDTTVPPGYAEAFHRALEPHYRDRPQLQRHLLFPESEHLMREEDWKSAWGETLRWLDSHLVAAG